MKKIKFYMIIQEIQRCETCSITISFHVHVGVKNLRACMLSRAKSLHSFFFPIGDKTAIDRMHTCNWACVTVVSRCFARGLLPLPVAAREPVTCAAAAVAFNLHPTDKRRG